MSLRKSYKTSGLFASLFLMYNGESKVSSKGLNITLASVQMTRTPSPPHGGSNHPLLLKPCLVLCSAVCQCATGGHLLTELGPTRTA